jgi:hypothetical protein
LSRTNVGSKEVKLLTAHGAGATRAGCLEPPDDAVLSYRQLWLEAECVEFVPNGSYDHRTNPLCPKSVHCEEIKVKEMIRTRRTIVARGVTFRTGPVEIRVTDAADVLSREMPRPGADRVKAHDLDFHFEGRILLP